MVNGQQRNGRATNGRATDKEGAVPLEVFMPVVSAGVKQGNHFPGIRINAGDIWPLV